MKIVNIFQIGLAIAESIGRLPALKRDIEQRTCQGGRVDVFSVVSVIPEEENAIAFSFCAKLFDSGRSLLDCESREVFTRNRIKHRVISWENPEFSQRLMTIRFDRQ